MDRADAIQAIREAQSALSVFHADNTNELINTLESVKVMINDQHRALEALQNGGKQ